MQRKMTETEVNAGRSFDASMPSESRFQLSFSVLWLVLIAAFFVKSPDAYISPQFWAEDGGVFFEQQLEFGWSSFFTPYAGYLHAIPRLIAGLASLFPGEFAPTFYNYSSLLLNAAFMAYFARSSDDTATRVAVIVGVLLMPTNGEAFGTITNTQWWSQFFLVAVVAERFTPAANWGRIAGRFFSVLLVALTGPFSVIVAATLFTVLLIQRVMHSAAPAWSHWPEVSDIDWRLRVTPLLLAALIQAAVLASSPSIGGGLSLNDAITVIGYLQGHMLGTMVIDSTIFVALFLAVVTFTTLLGGSGSRPSVLMILGGISVAQMIAASAKIDLITAGIEQGDRYFVAAKIFLLCSLVRVADLLRLAPSGRSVLALAVGASIAAASPEYFSRKSLHDFNWSSGAQLLDAEGGVTIAINPAPWTVVVGPGENLPGLGRARVLEMPVLQSEATPVPLIATVPVTISLPSSGRKKLTEIQVFIATYGTSPTGRIRIDACAGQHCFARTTALTGAEDNTFLRLPLAHAAASSRIDRVRITLLDPSDSVAIWSFGATAGSAVFSDGPQKGSAPMLRAIQKIE
jgi:hypothetical protein